MATIDNINTNDFKNLFSRDFPYLPLWVNGIAYFTGEIVFYNNNFYQSTEDGNTNVPDPVNTYYNKNETDEMISNLQNQITTNETSLNDLSEEVSTIKIFPTYEDLR